MAEFGNGGRWGALGSGMAETVANIGVRGRRRRLVLGLAAFAGAAVLAAGLSLSGAGPWARALVIVPLAGGCYGFFQYREKT